MEQTTLNNKRPGFGKWIIGGILITLLTSLILIMFSSSQKDTMISRAQRIMSWNKVPITNPMMSEYMILDHHWMPDGSLLRVPFSLGPKQTVSAQLEKLSVKTGQTTSNQPIALNSIQRSTLDEPLLSPDGKWLFLEDSGDYALVNIETGAVQHLKRGLNGASDFMIIASTKDSNIMTRISSKPGAKQQPARMNINFMMLANRVAWMPDSKSFLEISDNLVKRQTSLVMRSLDDKPQAAIPLRIYASGAPPKVLGVTTKGDAMVVDQAGPYVGNSYLLIDLKSKAVITHQFKNTPQGLLLKQIEMSPDRKRLLWKTVYVDPSPVGSVRLLLNQTVFHGDIQFRVSIKVSDLDGGNMREVCGEMLSGKQEDGFQTAHWMPDSKKISFWYKDAIYSVPAN